MKRLILVFTLLLAAVALRANAVDSRISAVTVYADRAVVTRSASASLSPGINEFVFEGLPANLQDQSLQVNGTGSVANTILDVGARQTFLAATPNPRAKELESQIEKLQQQDRALNDKAGVLRGQSSMINQLQTSAVALGTGEKSDRPKLDDVKTVLDYGQVQLLAIATSLQDIDRDRAALQDQISALQKQLGELRVSGPRSVKTVTVRVQAAEAGTMKLALNYTVGGASWGPSYDARVLTGEKAVQLGYFGNVRQNTGEDWNNVALTLSTARPSLGGAAPQLGVWNLNVESDSTIMQLPVAAAGKDYGYLKANSRSATSIGAEVQSTVAQATVDAGTTSATFKIAVPATIPSDGSSQKVPVTSERLNAAMDYTTTPKLQTTAFLNAKVYNNSDYPLLDGAMNVFLDGTFVATSRLATTMPGEKFDLALGADEGISVKHKRVQKFTEETGVFSKTHRITYEYLITIQNNKRTEERINVIDQVPLSRNEKIVVKVVLPPEKEAKPDDEGKLKWTFNLKPSEKRELTVKFTIDYPTDVKVDGLE